MIRLEYCLIKIILIVLLPIFVLAQFTPPYTLPTAGNAVEIGDSTVNSIRDLNMNTTEWNYSIQQENGLWIQAAGGNGR